MLAGLRQRLTFAAESTGGNSPVCPVLRRPRGLIGRAVGVAVAGMLLAAAPAAAEVVVLGSHPASPSSIQCGTSHACAFVQASTAATSPSYRVPFGERWTVSAWSHKSGPSSSGSIRLVMWRPDGAGAYSAVAASAFVAMSGTIGQTGLGLPVQGGDIVGLDISNSGTGAWRHGGLAGDTIGVFGSDPPTTLPGGAQTPSIDTGEGAFTNPRLNMTVTIQSDNDQDGIEDAADPDDDNDGVEDGPDNCDEIANPDQADNDAVGGGDACDHDDDNDDVDDSADNCDFVANADQAENDQDGPGDACDPDDDNDGQADVVDNCRTTANPAQTNSDNAADGGDACDPDDDNDGVNDGADNCPTVVDGAQTNTDGDPQGDACDADDDGDGVPDVEDAFPLDSTRSVGLVGGGGSGSQPTAGDDVLTGDPLANLLCGLAGDDTISGLAGDDTIFGDQCNENARVQVGAAGVGDGNDTLVGNEGDDTLVGSGGNDRLSGNDGNDRLLGGTGRDRLDGDAGNDSLDGGAENDVLNGGTGNDGQNGGAGNDRIAGGTGDDRLTGAAGDDSLSGGRGRNRYSAGAGNDVVNARNRTRETVNCGSGRRDRATVDRNDRVRGCERVTRRR